VPVLTPNPLFADAAGASFAPLRDGATPRGDSACSASAGFGPLAWDAALLINTAAFMPAGCDSAQAQPWQPAGADGRTPVSADASLSEAAARPARRRRRRDLGPLEASLPRLSAGEPRSAGAGAAAMRDSPGPRTGAADASAERAAAASGGATGCAPSAGPAAALAAAAARLAALEAHAGAAGRRAAAAQAALAGRRAAISARQRAHNESLVRPLKPAAHLRERKHEAAILKRTCNLDSTLWYARQGARLCTPHATIASTSTLSDLPGLLSFPC